MCGRFALTDNNRQRVADMLGAPVDRLVEIDCLEQLRLELHAGTTR